MKKIKHIYRERSPSLFLFLSFSMYSNLVGANELCDHSNGMRL